MTPYGRTAIRFFRKRPERIACLEREILLNGVNGREVVVFDFAKLEKAISFVSSEAQQQKRR
jgi:ribosomal protein L34E